MTPTQPAPTDWLVRLTADPAPRRLSTAAAVLVGVRDGDWETTDEVRGPGDRMWVPIEEHPVFADAVAEMGPPPPEPVDETHLDMNPLIDVALVLLIFFILTATVATLRRTIVLPPPQSEETQNPTPQAKDLEDRTFTLMVTLDEREEPVVKVSTGGGAERVIPYDKLEQEMKEVVDSTGRKEMILKMANDVKWKTSVRVHSAATKAGVNKVYMYEKNK
jgi:biopolymer transport protein ExbD